MNLDTDLARWRDHLAQFAALLGNPPDRSAPAGTLWGDFRRTQGVFAGPGGLEDGQVQAVRNAFDQRNTPVRPEPAGSAPR